MINFIKYSISRKIVNASRQIYLQKQKEDSAFKELLKNDQQSSLQEIEGENFVPESKKGDSQIARVKETLKETNTHIIQKDKFTSALKKFNIQDKDSKAVIRDAIQQEFFLMKKMSEEQAKFEEELKVKKRKSEMKNIFKEIEDIDLQPDNQYEEQIPYFNKLTQEEKFEKIEEWNKRYSILGKIDPYLLQRARTSKNIENFITMNVEEDSKLYDSSGISKALSISQILTNQACTVVWVFIKFIDVKDEESQNKILNKLNKKSKMLGWKMCQDLGLKYGPDIRFSVSKREEKIYELQKEIDENAEQIVKQDLVERYEKGEIPKKIKKEQFDNIVKELKVKKAYLQDEISNASLIQRKRTSEQKNITKKQSVQTDKSAAEKFWDQL